jgi:acyl-CoA synthetase (AMP-forming)/AMP-acid ligase II
VQREGATATLGVPTMLAATVDEQLSNPRDVATLALYGHGASPVALEVLRKAVEAFPHAHLVHLYGATETSPLLTGLRHEERLLGGEHQKSCGQPVIGVEVVVRSPDGTPCPDGEPGEVTARGPNVMAGYWQKPAQTAAALRDGWYWTGDIGRMDADGYLFLLDRSKDMIVSGGENVYSAEVENALAQHPSVATCAVIGVPDADWGERVHAVVVLQDGASATAEELREHCGALIARYKAPRSVEFVDALPLTPAVKIDKRALRARYWDSESRSVN